MIDWMMVTHLGSSALLFPIALAIAACLFLGRSRQIAWLWLKIFLAGVLLVFVSKALFFGWGIGLKAIDFTGFSGHAMLAGAVYPTVAYLALHKRAPRMWPWIVAALGLIGLLVAISRVALNAHSVSEVISGLTIGYLVSCVFIVRSQRSRAAHLNPNLLLAILGLLFVMLYGTQFPTETWIATIAAWLAGHAQPFMRKAL